MKRINTTLLLTLIFNIVLMSQEIVKLATPLINTDVQWPISEKEYHSDTWKTEVITNVSSPELIIYRPQKPNGTAVIIAPGGGLYAHSIESEGRMVAKWLSERGITGIVLKYRLVPTGDDGPKEMETVPLEGLKKRLAPVFPLAFDDALNAMKYVRGNAKTLNINPQKIGFMGFSAGGAVTMGLVYNYTAETRPNFLAQNYPWTVAYPVQLAPEDGPPMFIVCASDDPLGLAKGSIALYNSWLKTQLSVELHMYAEGGHGFGMRTLGTPSDKWIERFGEWLSSQGFME